MGEPKSAQIQPSGRPETEWPWYHYNSSLRGPRAPIFGDKPLIGMLPKCFKQIFDFLIFFEFLAPRFLGRSLVAPIGLPVALA